MNEKTMYTVSASPHVRSDEDTRKLMIDVIVALVPALLVAIMLYGPRAFTLTLTGAFSCMFFELLYTKLMKKPTTIGDMSAVVTGVLLVYCLPVTVPHWLVVIGSFFAIVVVKQLFGGIGKNFLNPALTARAFLFAWPVLMTTWVKPFEYLPAFKKSVDMVTTATPLYLMRQKETLPTLWDMFVGNIGGCIGETSALMLILGGIYLIARKVISPRIPLSFLLTVAALTFIFPKTPEATDWMLYQLLAGGLMLGAFFMATDYVTSPVTPRGQIIFGVGCGLITVFIRYFGSYPEGVSYGIMIMNLLVWVIDKYTFPKKFGGGVK